MAINTLAAATLFMTMLDKVAVQEATTGWMDANAGRVIYNGGNEVKIPKMSFREWEIMTGITDIHRLRYSELSDKNNDSGSWTSVQS